jgi:hypothetical protein
VDRQDLDSKRLRRELDQPGDPRFVVYDQQAVNQWHKVLVAEIG